MFCSRCGRELAPEERSCAHCGTPVMGYSGLKDKKNPKSKGKKRKALLLGIVAIVAAIALTAVLLVAGSPQARVAAAVASTAREFSAVLEVWDLQQPHPLMKREELSCDLDFQLTDVSADLGGALSGLGIRMESDVNLPDRKLGLRLTPYYGSVDILHLQTAVLDDIAYIGIPELLPDAFYGVNTVTMMADLQAMGLNVGEAASVSFNFFDIIEIIRKYSPDTREAEALIRQANADLAKSIQMERLGKQTLSINGSSVKCRCYRVSIPASELKAWLQTMEHAGNNGNSQDLTREVWQSMGLPQYLVEEMVRNVAAETPDTSFSAIYDYLEKTGDMELTVAISKGKLAQVSYREQAEEKKVSAVLSLGGTGEYTDALCLELLADGSGISVSSQGNHGAKGGIFTDETAISFFLENTALTNLILTTELDTRRDQDNLFFRCKDKAGDFEITVSGSRVIRDERVALELDKCAVTVDGEKQLGCRVVWVFMPFQNRTQISGARMLSDMDADALTQTLETVRSNLLGWVIDLVEEVPALLDLL